MYNISYLRYLILGFLSVSTPGTIHLSIVQVRSRNTEQKELTIENPQSDLFFMKPENFIMT